MNFILENKKFWIVLFLFFVLILLNIFSARLVGMVVENHYDKIADSVIKKLQKEYCPSPYGPGINPDKIDLDKFLQK